MTKLGDLFRLYHYAANPVTKAVYREIISNRLDSLSKTTNSSGGNRTTITRSRLTGLLRTFNKGI